VSLWVSQRNEEVEAGMAASGRTTRVRACGEEESKDACMQLCSCGRGAGASTGGLVGMQQGCACPRERSAVYVVCA
jgi:hypothetical protein